MAFLKWLAPALALSAAGAAQAHVVADPRQAAAGGYQVVRFRVGHACTGAAATTELRVEMPRGLASARPQPKPGWTLSVEQASGAVALIWRGHLPDEEFDEFAVLVCLPQQPGVLYFPTVQTCGAAVERWTETPDAADPGKRPSRPAPVLEVLPAAAPAMPSHHH
jgi:uncharacterized protein YcnI